MGNVTIPVDATFAEAEPDIDPNNAEARTDTFAAPPLSLPKCCHSNIHKAFSCFTSIEYCTKNESNTATMDTDTPVRVPHRPPSVIIKVPKKLFIGIPACPNSPGICWPNRP